MLLYTQLLFMLSMVEFLVVQFLSTLSSVLLLYVRPFLIYNIRGVVDAIEVTGIGIGSL